MHRPSRLVMVAALPLACLLAAPPASAQQEAPVAGTRLDITARGEVTRAPDLATLTAGVVTDAATAAEAMRQNAGRMAAAAAALRRAGVADRDIRTAELSLQPRYRNEDNGPPQITGYEASDQLTVTFRDIARAGPILDALVGQGVNQVSGPDFALEHPEAAMDEARVQAVRQARQRAELYAKAAGLTVRRIVSISEDDGASPQPPRPFVMMARAEKASTDLAPGEERISVTIHVSFELQ